MKTFLDALEADLASLAEHPHTAHGSPRPRAALPAAQRYALQKPRGCGRRIAAVCAVLASVGVAAVVAPLTWAPESLPVFDAPTADASSLDGRPGVPSASKYALRDSRRFQTRGGAGYVVASKDGEQVCLVIPDARTPGTFGSGCASLARVKRRGLAGELGGPASRGHRGESTVAFVLPAGTDPELRLTGPRGPIPFSVSGGVATATLRSAATLHYEVRGTPRRHEFEAPLGRSDDYIAVRCRGYEVRLPVPEPSSAGPPPAYRLDGECRNPKHRRYAPGGGRHGDRHPPTRTWLAG